MHFYTCAAVTQDFYFWEINEGLTYLITVARKLDTSLAWAVGRVEEELGDLKNELQTCQIVVGVS